MDYDLKRNGPDDMAQILQLKSTVDIIYDYDGIYKELLCSKKPLDPKIPSLVIDKKDSIIGVDEKIEEEKVDSYLKEYRYLR